MVNICKKTEQYRARQRRRTDACISSIQHRLLWNDTSNLNFRLLYFLHFHFMFFIFFSCWIKANNTKQQQNNIQIKRRDKLEVQNFKTIETESMTTSICASLFTTYIQLGQFEDKLKVFGAFFCSSNGKWKEKRNGDPFAFCVCVCVIFLVFSLQKCLVNE